MISPGRCLSTSGSIPHKILATTIIPCNPFRRILTSTFGLWSLKDILKVQIWEIKTYNKDTCPGEINSLKLLNDGNGSRHWSSGVKQPFSALLSHVPF
ncbi:Hypothetical predicted protein [Podarcis lilfordi]|uniref:Uncharacterized protein n=1 Tax=Podarcis lilfordi TaxID=74358 RepID=A0AA35JMV2_9SAUR|nr:Hypothetical predicted protein [Podarcis lilfordi]